ncbi:MAG: hypothetical protein U0R44_01210 [Candidatus Micrarchaeia archaeon]
MRALFVMISVILLIAAGCAQQTPAANNTTACTQEAKICPDGSAVGRTGPNCEFAPCPEAKGNGTDPKGCTTGNSWCDLRQQCTPPSECKISLEEALSIAWSGKCAEAGMVTGVNASYNDNSRTWWLDIQANRTGCSPACVVYENRSSEVNWRCTGAIPPYTVKVANATGLGEILTDGNGYTLYVFTADSAGKSSCFGTCEKNWPPLVVTGDIVVPKLPGNMGAFARDNKTIQASYNGMPLYYYAGDSKPGDTNGQGIGGKWFAAKPGMETFPN